MILYYKGDAKVEKWKTFLKVTFGSLLNYDFFYPTPHSALLSGQPSPPLPCPEPHANSDSSWFSSLRKLWSTCHSWKIKEPQVLVYYGIMIMMNRVLALPDRRLGCNTGVTDLGDGWFLVLGRVLGLSKSPGPEAACPSECIGQRREEDRDASRERDPQEEASGRKEW